MSRWMRPPELDRHRGRDRFDPVVQGEPHGLPADIAEQLWNRICAEVVEGARRGDTDAGRQRFREVAPKLAAHRRRT